jgi:hypothetical protein
MQLNPSNSAHLLKRPKFFALLIYPDAEVTNVTTYSVIIRIIHVSCDTRVQILQLFEWRLLRDKGYKR